MTDHERPVEPMGLYQLYWSAGGASGTINIEAPDGDTAIATVEATPSLHGIPHEHPIVGHARLLPVREESIRERAA